MKNTREINLKVATQARQRIKANKHPKANMRLLVIALRGEGKKLEEIAEVTGYTSRQVSRIIAKFKNHGFNAIIKDKRKGNNRKVTLQEERKFFKKYREQAQKGEIITADGMWKDFQETFKVKIDISAFYKMLKRNGWRKVMPQLQHKKSADAKTIKASKKLSQNTKNQEKHSIWVVDKEKCE